MRTDVTDNDIYRAVVKVIRASFDESRWLEFGLEVGVLQRIKGHPRLLRGVKYSNEDYPGIVIDVVPQILHHKDPQGGSRPKTGPYARLPNLAAVEDFLDLAHWLEQNDRPLYAALYAGTDESVVNDVDEVAQRLSIEEVSENASRIRRGLRHDPVQALGSAKELLESVFKSILGLHGNGRDTLVDLPGLAKRANVALGVDPAGVRGDEPGADQRRRLFSALNSIVTATAELRNGGFSTGHGGSKRAKLDAATNRLAVNAAVSLALFYIEAWDGQSPSEHEIRR